MGQTASPQDRYDPLALLAERYPIIDRYKRADIRRQQGQVIADASLRTAARLFLATETDPLGPRHLAELAEAVRHRRPAA